ncbi:hypothetical protein D3C81_1487100 [compost metagenome]
MRPGNARRQVDTGDHVAVVQAGAGAIAPGVGGVEAVVAALALSGVSGERTGRPRNRSGAIYRAATKAQLRAGGIGQAIDAVVADLADQGQAAGAPDLVDELCRGDLCLEHRHALVAIDVGSGHCGRSGRDEAGGDQRRGGAVQGAVQQVRGIELQRHVRPVTDFAPQRGAADVGLEAQAVEADVFREIDEVT